MNLVASDTVVDSDKAPHCYADALIIPAPTGRLGQDILPMAVLDAVGDRIDTADCATNTLHSRNFHPTDEQKVEKAELSGRWLYGGIATRHFGHQITRMLGRLPWMEDAGDIDGIVFAGFRRSSNARNERNSRAALLDLFGVDCPVEVVFEPTRVDELVIGPDLFSEATKCRADPRFRTWVRKKIGLEEMPILPGKKVYITRDRLPGTAGRILAEQVLEENLTRNGFEIFAPEEHDLKSQIRTYAEAETIVMTDGSSGHVSAFAFRDGQSQTIIARRNEPPRYLVNHLKSFAKDGGQLNFSTQLKQQWWPPQRTSNVAQGEVDFDATKIDLQSFGVLPADPVPWRAPSLGELNASKRRDLAMGQSLIPDHDRAAFLDSLRINKRSIPMLNELDDAAHELPDISGLRYLRVLNRLHGIIKPDWYLEVGTFTGRSLSLAQGNYVAIDPMFRIEHPIVNSGAQRMYLFQETSDSFFESKFLETNKIQPNMAFLDGLHHFEVLLRDFINAEKRMAKGGIIALHDCCPTTHAMTSRVQGPGAWTGDVWKTLLILKRNRPDLTIDVLDAAPTGLVLIRDLDPRNETLEQAYDALVAEYAALSFDQMDGGLSAYYSEVDVIPALDGLERVRQSREGQM